ncbi:hypothetical protein RKE29_09910 [Streptomyces sp. B1866]|uniref:hypothetical protein n=1 Tax=Streptomyces sp. B1866 TaxID=3075431 RepID=UPI00288EDE53|nr:hypothetical protein [Streptomyces sp. B1866]MDT3396957.1 hypothetical protein [Streptomyces sp. B1866]
MRKAAKGTVALAAVCAAVACGTAAASPMSAAATWRVSPAGNVTYTSQEVTIKGKTSGFTVRCTASFGGEFYKEDQGSLGKIPNMYFNKCNSGITDMGTTGESIRTVSYNAGTGTATLDLYSLGWVVRGSSCNSSITPEGSLQGLRVAFKNATSEMTITESSHLRARDSAAPCFTPGEAIDIRGTFKISPAQKITLS